MKACSAETERELELMKLRKMLAWLTAVAMLGTAALATGCGSEETSSSKAETSAAETEEAADAADDAEVDELAEDDAELTNQIASIPWSYDVENDVMILNNNVIMAQADNYSFSDAATAMQEMATAAKVQEYLQGTYWVGTDDTSASAISMSSDTLEIIELSQDGTLDQGSFLWSMDYDTLNAYDENYNLLASFGWDISEDGSELQLTSDGESIVYTQVSEEDANAVVEYLYSAMGLEESAE